MRRRPGAPFTTATLQQEAARRLGLAIKRTMAIAQALYEGIDLAGERVGLITYMRTDGVTVSKAALEQARRTVRREHGAGYVSRAPRVFRSRARNVREAHEAIRPTDFARTPQSLAGRVEPDAARPYGLIRDRALASQMAQARLERVEVELASARGDVVLAAAGTTLAFDGYLRVYRDGTGEAPGVPAGAGPPVPALAPGARVNEDEQGLIASISKSMAMMCVRNTMLEDIHAGIEPVSRTAARRLQRRHRLGSSRAAQRHGPVLGRRVQDSAGTRRTLDRERIGRRP